jgi:hypothetical protein
MLVIKIDYDWETYKYSENMVLLCANEEKLLRDIDTYLFPMDYKVFIRDKIRKGRFDVHIATTCKNDLHDAKMLLVRMTPLWKSINKE